MKVPASTSALPPTSSLWRRCCGISEYFSGPKMVASTPSRKISASSVGTWPKYSAAAAQNIRMTSASRVWRISRLFSYLSASWPASAENRKNGRMNSPCARFESMPALPAADRRAVGDRDHQRVAKQVVVECAEELREEERQEAPVPSSANCERSAPGTCSGSSIRLLVRQSRAAWRAYIACSAATCQNASASPASKTLQSASHLYRYLKCSASCSSPSSWPRRLHHLQAVDRIRRDSDLGIVKLSYEYRKFENPQVDERAGIRWRASAARTGASRTRSARAKTAVHRRHEDRLLEVAGDPRVPVRQSAGRCSERGHEAVLRGQRHQNVEQEERPRRRGRISRTPPGARRGVPAARCRGRAATTCSAWPRRRP